MKNRPRFWNTCGALVITALVLVGCVGASARVELYTLSSLSALEEGPQAGASAGDIAIGLGPLGLPKFLDRPQIVTRASANRIEVSEFHRWGSPLHAEFLRVLAENIAILLRTNRVAAYPWEDRFDPTYRIALDVQQFEGRLGEYVQLNATWLVTGRDATEILLVKESTIKEPVARRSYEDFVAAESRALAALSREIADEMRRLLDI